MKILKYQFRTDDEFELSLPEGSTILKVAVQGATPTMWVLRPEEKDQKLIKEVRKFRVFGTGASIPSDIDLRYIDSYFEGIFVWHLFELWD